MQVMRSPRFPKGELKEGKENNDELLKPEESVSASKNGEIILFYHIPIFMSIPRNYPRPGNDNLIFHYSKAAINAIRNFVRLIVLPPA